MAMDDIDYTLHGDDMQCVEIELDPGEAAIGEAGSLMFMEDGIEMDTVIGDGSEQHSGVFGRLLGAGKRLITGESLFTTVYVNEGKGRKKLAFVAPYTGRIIPFDLKQHGGALVCQKDAFLCAAKGVALGIAFQKRLGAGFFGGEGFIMQKLEGDGLAFCHSGGTVLQRTLAPEEILRVDTGCVVAYTPGIDFDIQFVGGIKTAIFGGEGLFLATLRGPGRVIVQSMTLEKLRRELAPSSRGGDERGPLESLGGFFSSED